MPCKKSELASMINSFGNARASGDQNLIRYSADALGNLLETLEFSPEKQGEEVGDADKSE
jgi:hypothetical protein